MAKIKEPEERRQEPGVVATVNEAAYVAGVSKHAVNQAIDRHEIRTRKLRRKTDPGGRAVGGPELVYLRVQNLLSSKARKQVYRRLSGLSIETVPPVIEMEGAVGLDIREPVAEVRARLQELTRINSQVEENPKIRGGEPVFRGTRIPIHMIAVFLEQGVARAEILEDYPALSEESLKIAERYAELYPRRGRPKQAPWRSQKPTHVFRPEEMHG
jgi:uncharacterized protein (DUF433 family)